MPDRMPDRMPEDMSDRMPEDMPDRMPEDLPDRMPEDRMPEDMLDRMPNRMSEDMSDRMPEDLPVRKCINVMVGITRSKVIFIDLTSTYKLWRFWYLDCAEASEISPRLEQWSEGCCSLRALLAKSTMPWESLGGGARETPNPKTRLLELFA